MFRRPSYIKLMIAFVGISFFITDVVDARRRRRRRKKRGAKYKYVIKAGEATHALKPLSGIGIPGSRAARLTNQVNAQLGRLAGIKMAPLKKIRKYLKGRYGAPYATCQLGDLDCPMEFGRKIKAPLLVIGELAAMSQLVHLSLRLIDPEKKIVVRSISVNAPDNAKAIAVKLREAAYRLLSPEKYVGSLKVEVDVTGASIYLNGKPYGKSPIKKVTIQAGTHALRVTHDKYHDFVRFVSVGFEKSSEVKVSLTQYPIIKETMKVKARRKVEQQIQPGQKVIWKPLPWYNRWWFITSVAAGVLLVTVTTVVLARPPRLDRDASITINPRRRAPAGVTLGRWR